MEKTLTPNGNSLALTIERPLLKALGITKKTVLKITTDGRRLLVEPIRIDPAAKAHELSALGQLDAYRMLYTLVHHLGMSQQHFAQVSPRRKHFVGLLGVLQAQLELDEADLLTVERLNVCRTMLAKGGTWENAIAEALRVRPGAPT